MSGAAAEAAGGGAFGPRPAGHVRIDVREKVYPAVAERPARRVLRDIHLDIAPRSFVVVTGPSGCGKSTLLNIVAGLDCEFDGRVDLGGADETDTGPGSARAPNLAFVFQTPRLLPWRTVEQNIALALPDGDPRHARIADLLASVGLTESASAYPERISLGMQRRAALARAFILEPDILLMDEPFVSLDEPTAVGLRQLLIDLYNRRPTTVLFVTHDRAEAVTLATRILRMGGSNATIDEDVDVRLSREDRANRDAIAAEQQRIFGTS